MKEVGSGHFFCSEWTAASIFLLTSSFWKMHFLSEKKFHKKKLFFADRYLSNGFP
jgi:hypothetical protein